MAQYNDKTLNDYLPNIFWSDNPSGVSEEFPYELVAIRKKINGSWGDFSTPVLWATYQKGIQGEPGKDGEPGKETIIYNTTSSAISILGQIPRITSWEPNTVYFAQGQDQIPATVTPPESDVITIGESSRPKYYDLVYYTNSSKQVNLYKCDITHLSSNELAPGKGPQWILAEKYDIIKANTALINNLISDSITTNKFSASDILVLKNFNGNSNPDNIECGMVSGSNQILNGTESQNLRIFAGVPETGLKDSKFRVYNTGKVIAEDAEIKGKITATSGSFTGHVVAKSGSFKGTINALGGEFTGVVKADSFEFLKNGNTVARFKYYDQSETVANETIPANTVVLEVKSGSDWYYLPLSSMLKTNSTAIDVATAYQIQYGEKTGMKQVTLYPKDNIFYTDTAHTMEAGSSYFIKEDVRMVCRPVDYDGNNTNYIVAESVPVFISANNKTQDKYINASGVTKLNEVMQDPDLYTDDLIESCQEDGFNVTINQLRNADTYVIKGTRAGNVYDAGFDVIAYTANMDKANWDYYVTNILPNV